MLKYLHINQAKIDEEIYTNYQKKLKNELIKNKIK